MRQETEVKYLWPAQFPQVSHHFSWIFIKNYRIPGFSRSSENPDTPTARSFYTTVKDNKCLNSLQRVYIFPTHAVSVTIARNCCRNNSALTKYFTGPFNNVTSEADFHRQVCTNGLILNKFPLSTTSLKNPVLLTKNVHDINCFLRSKLKKTPHQLEHLLSYIDQYNT